MRIANIPHRYRMSKKPTRNHDGVKVCIYCNCEIVPPLYLTREHLVPKSKGGNNRVLNLRAACNLCNHSRGNMELKEWLKTPGLTDRQKQNISDLITFVNTNRHKLTKTFNLECKLSDVNSRWKP